MKIKWEYQIVSIPQLGKATDVLNEHGKQGWELVQVERPNYYMKRRIE